MSITRQTAIVIGAGPAGLTAALEMLRRTGIKPIVLEASQEIGGISRTIRYKGNRMDIGGHRFFSKSDRVMQWWMDIMPVETTDAPAARIAYRGQSRSVATTPANTPPANIEEITDPDCVMLVRPRKSRIYYLRKFFDYPVKLTGATLVNMGVMRTVRVGVSYLYSRVHQIRPETSLQDFLINRFGNDLYLTFFKSYTEKVWGTPCDRISAEWGAQRIKGLSLTTALKHFLKQTAEKATANTKKQTSTDLAQEDTDTSLIERFMYPKLGPGQLWEHVADKVCAMGGEIRLGLKVVGIECVGERVAAVQVEDTKGCRERIEADYFFSTMPMRELVQAMDAPVPANVQEVSDGLQYRDFITVGLLADKLKVKEKDGTLLKDTWIYVQEPDVLLGRLQIFNNWSPHLVSDPTKVWIGLEYFCYETDDLWKMKDDALKQFAIEEVIKIGLLEAGTVTDSHVVRVPKTYPAYFGTYDRFHELRDWTDTFENLFLVGRNGMHKYNNQDHSMLTAMSVVDGLCAGYVNKAALWEINTEQDYHEEEEKGAELNQPEMDLAPSRHEPQQSPVIA